MPSDPSAHPVPAGSYATSRLSHEPDNGLDWATVVLRCAQMAQADAWAMAHGQPGVVLMERAGAGVVQALTARWLPCPVWVWCGPGNNGGDGWVIARLLEAAGWPQVSVACDSPIESLQGDAAHHAQRWRQARLSRAASADVHTLDQALQAIAVQRAHAQGRSGPHSPAVLVVDALFGAGLSRPLDEKVHAALAQLATWRTGDATSTPGCVQVVAVDVPSGLHGDTAHGLADQTVPCPADLTVTFMAPKPAHVLMHGRALMGDLVVHDIGLPLAALQAVAAQAQPVELWRRNTPVAWGHAWQAPRRGGHKYHRGHVLVWSGPRMPGASRLAARIGAGLVTLAMTRTAWPHLAGHLMSAMAHPLADESADALCADWRALLASRRWNAIVLGPGAMLGLPEPQADTLRTLVLDALATEVPLVLDADALMAFEGHPQLLCQALNDRHREGAPPSVVLTPHEGEFNRLFGDLVRAEAGQAQATAGDPGKFERTRLSAAMAGAVVLHKGADTVLAAPDGRVMLHDDAPPWLSTGGSGDVLAGFIAGLMAQGVDAWHAACGAAWVHGQCGHRFGPGLLADDLPEQVPGVLRRLWGVPPQ
jgi:ADP-dependent NAD(P)H-hydrate dehydratase / NAD(P)H-hydrate epimerase